MGLRPEMEKNSKHQNNKSFVHLHVHSFYSLLDGQCSPEELIKKAKDEEMPAVAITDHGAMYGVVEFYKQAKAAGIKPIIGCEVYVAAKDRFRKDPMKDKIQYHLLLLAKDETGYKNLLKMVSKAYYEGFYYKPRVDYELLETYNEGIIALSACLSGEISSLILNNQYQSAKQRAKKLKEIYGCDNFYLELQDHGLTEEKQVNAHLWELSNELGVGVVATNDVHYLNKDDASTHDVLLCVQTGNELEDEDRLQFPTGEFYFKSTQEMEEIFSDYPGAVANTLRIAEKCQVAFDFNALHLPEFSVPGEHDENSFLQELCYQGLKERGMEHDKGARDRLDYELRMIERMGYAAYFLIVWDFVKYAHENNILVGPGRGSAAGSLVAYCLKITNIDPLKYNLLFERFLNPERVNMPDIDIDFCYEKREEVIEYVINKYGEDRVAQIITFGTMQARAAVRDVGRVMGMSYSQVDRVAKMIPHEPDITINKALESKHDLKELYQEDPQVRELLNISRAIEGIPRHASTHAAGIVIAKEPLTEYVPLQCNDDQIVTQFPMGTLEELGLLKMDFLGLKTLTMMNWAVNIIYKTRGQSVNLDQIPMDDDNTYRLICQGKTLGVFQLESSGMRNVLKELKPTRFEEIIATSALYRPGPMEQIPNFIDSKHGRKPVSYPHPDLKPILQETYGIMVYQEQIMQVASKMAGFSLGEADILRRAIGKKKKKILAQQKEKFVEGCVERGYSRDLGEHVYNLIVKFADYGFNKSHSAAYAYIAYQSAYLKANYPVEFMAALLTNSMNDTDKLAHYIEDAKSMDIEILPPDINESLVDFTVVGEVRIRFGLAAVKNVGRGAVEEIINSRKKDGEFESFCDFCTRVNLRYCNKKVIESLIKVGAFDSLDCNRKQLLQVLDEAIKKGQAFTESVSKGQVSMWDLMDEDIPKIDLTFPQVEEFNLNERLNMEKELLGFFLSGHPLDYYQELLANQKALSLHYLHDKEDQSWVRVGGIAQNCKEILTRNGQQMAFCTLEDRYGSVELVVFPGVYQQSKHLLAEGIPVFIEGRLDQKEEDIKILVERLEALAGSSKMDEIKENDEQGRNKIEKEKQIYIKVSQEVLGKLEEIKASLYSEKGELPVFLYFPERKKLAKVPREYFISDRRETLARIAQIVGEDAVKVCWSQDKASK